MQRDALFKRAGPAAVAAEEDTMRAPVGQGIYTADEQMMLQKAKEQNRETTRLAQEALKTVQQTEETAAGTLEELHRQDGQLDKIEKDYETIEADLKEAKQAVNYMNRCCCLFCCACCCDLDQHSKKDKTRQQRVAVRSDLAKEEKKFAELTSQDKSAKAVAQARGQAQTLNGQEDSNRAELMGAQQRLANRDGGINPANHIGEGLEDGDRAKIQGEVQQQEDAMDLISQHLDNIQNMAVAMGDTMRDQDSKIDRLAGRNDFADDSMKDLQKRMKKI